MGPKTKKVIEYIDKYEDSIATRLAVDELQRLSSIIDEHRSTIAKLNKTILDQAGIILEYEKKIEDLESDIVLIKNEVM